VDSALGERAQGSRSPAPAPLFHPMRGTPLAHVLHSHVLTPKNAEIGRLGLDDNSNFELSHDASRCTFFLSHSWQDDGAKKEALLSFFFEYGRQISALTVMCLVLAVFLSAFAVSLNSAVQLETRALLITLPLVPITVLALVLSWVALSVHGHLPTRLTPAGVSGRLTGGMTAWLDKTCVDQTNVAGFLDQGIDAFLMRCDCMVAFTSTSYFSRAWCVFELATWCHEYQDNLGDKLFLVSLEWGHFASWTKTPTLSDEEAALLYSFSLENVRSFKPCDRADVLAAIRRRWGDEEAFETFVRTKLPTILAKCKRQYHGVIGHVMGETLDKLLES